MTAPLCRLWSPLCFLLPLSGAWRCGVLGTLRLPIVLCRRSVRGVESVAPLLLVLLCLVLGWRMPGQGGSRDGCSAVWGHESGRQPSVSTARSPT